MKLNNINKILLKEDVSIKDTENFFRVFKRSKTDVIPYNVTVEFLGPDSIKGQKETIKVNISTKGNSSFEFFFDIAYGASVVFGTSNSVVDQDGNDLRKAIEIFCDKINSYASAHSVESILTVYNKDNTEVGAFSIFAKKHN
jgi:hypothetical protein